MPRFDIIGGAPNLMLLARTLSQADVTFQADDDSVTATGDDWSVRFIGAVAVVGADGIQGMTGQITGLEFRRDDGTGADVSGIGLNGTAMSNALASVGWQAYRSLLERFAKVDWTVIGSDGDDRLHLFGNLGIQTVADNPNELPRYGDQVVLGGDGDDILRGARGDDRIFGENGDDQIWRSSGRDMAYGGDGNDMVGNATVRAVEASVLFGDAGDDRLIGLADGDVMFGGDGNDDLQVVVQNNRYAFTLDGGAGDDVLRDGRGDDLVRGGAGDDRLYGGGGLDNIFAGDGNDTIKAGYGDTVFAGDGDDVIGGRSKPGFRDGMYYPTALFGGDGNDVIGGGHSSADIDAGTGDDRILIRKNWGSLTGGDGADTFLSQQQTAYPGIVTITDFDAAEGDRLIFRPPQAEWQVLQVGADVHITWSTFNDPGIVLVGITLADLDYTPGTFEVV